MYTCMGCTCQGEGYLCAHVWGAHVGCRASVCTWMELLMSRGKVSVCTCQGESTHMHMYGGAHVRARVSMCTCVRVHMCIHAYEGQKLMSGFFSIIIQNF